MNVIYEPTGRAREYAPLAMNIYTGCAHGCKYCYAPSALRKERGAFHNEIQPRKGLIKNLIKDCLSHQGDQREILLCFGCDPYTPGTTDMTRTVLQILAAFNMQVTILTKAGTRAMRDFDILAENNWSFGTTLLFTNDEDQVEWEPEAASISDRVVAIDQAHRMGIRTWVSVEPTIDPYQAIGIMTWLKNTVDHWKVGKLNYNKPLEDTVDWAKYLKDVERVLKGHSYYIKHDLLEAAGRL